jgi:hypothetical protein
MGGCDRLDALKSDTVSTCFHFGECMLAFSRPNQNHRTATGDVYRERNSSDFLVGITMLPRGTPTVNGGSLLPGAVDYQRGRGATARVRTRSTRRLDRES